MNHLSGLLEATELAIDVEWRFNRHDRAWKDEALQKHSVLLDKIRHKYNSEGECAVCRCIFQAPLTPGPCGFCGSTDVRSIYFC